jgi:hypothetical protein
MNISTDLQHLVDDVIFNRKKKQNRVDYQVDSIIIVEIGEL